MKYAYLLIAALLVSLTVGAQETSRERRVQERETRNAAAMRQMDSIILSRNFRFTPNTMRIEPAGMLNNIYDLRYYIQMNGEQDVDFFFPIIRGVTPPYSIVLMNYISTDILNYRTVQGNDNWTVEFSSRLQDTEMYNFSFRIYPITGETVLTLTTSLNPAVTYTGRFEGTR